MVDLDVVAARTQDSADDVRGRIEDGPVTIGSVGGVVSLSRTSRTEVGRTAARVGRVERELVGRIGLRASGTTSESGRSCGTVSVTTPCGPFVRTL